MVDSSVIGQVAGSSYPMHERCADFGLLGINKNVLDMMVLTLSIQRNPGGSMPGYDLPPVANVSGICKASCSQNDAFTADKVSSTTPCGKTVASVTVHKSLSLRL